MLLRLRCQGTHQHHFEERAVFVGRGMRAVGTNESNTYRRTHRENTVFRSGYQYSRTSATFKVVEFDHFKARAGLPSFTLSVSEWIDSTNAIGLIVKNGRYGGTYAQKDIAFEFGSAISVLFKLYLIDEFLRLKAAEQAQLGWSVKRELAKINYRIHTDAIQ